MQILRFAFIVLLMAWLASGAVKMLRGGGATLRGGVRITRQRNPRLFWASMAVQCIVLAAGLVLLLSLVAHSR